MRSLVQFEVVGATLNEIVDKATVSWREFTNNPVAELPLNTEINTTQTATDDYRGVVLIQTKVEDVI